MSPMKQAKFFCRHTREILFCFKDKQNRMLAEKVIGICEMWLSRKNTKADELYEMLVNEENGITIPAENTNDETEATAWNCVIDTVAYICRMAYEAEGAKYVPEPIELVDEELIKHFMQCHDSCLCKEKNKHA